VPENVDIYQSDADCQFFWARARDLGGIYLKEALMEYAQQGHTPRRVRKFAMTVFCVLRLF
jgi:hypothetical protein